MNTENTPPTSSPSVISALSAEPSSHTVQTEQAIQAVQVRPYKHEQPLFWISVYFAVQMWLLMLVFSLGLIIPIMLFLGFCALFTGSLWVAWLRGNGVQITATQFPDLYAQMQACSQRLGFAKQPEFFLLQSQGSLNALALRFLRRDYVVLLAEVVDALESRPSALKFYIGHEMGHIHRKHLSRHWWLWPGLIVPILASAYSRAKEYTCDRYGFACCDSVDDAQRALAVLAAGTQRWQHLNLVDFQAQSDRTGGFWMAVNELTADYPWLCKRMVRIANRDAQFPRRSAWAWLIAVFSPRLGYGGAVVGAIYALFIALLIVFLILMIGQSDDGWMMQYFRFIRSAVKAVFGQGEVIEDIGEDFE
jgi:Zn-dependent protease with chaperone function